MYKFFTLTSIFLLISFFAQAQTAVGTFTLKNQAQVDSFLTEHPNITKVEGSLFIGIVSPPTENSNITDLTGFSQLKEVTEDLMLSKIPAITDLNFLNNLETVSGGLFIDEDSSLVDISGLSNLKTLGYSLAVCMNQTLKDLTGIQQFTTVNGSLYVFGNEELESYSQLSNITSIKGNLHIFLNPKITDLSGFENLTNVDGEIKIHSNPLLSSCAVDYFCNNIGNSSKFFISQNATGCATIAEVEAACVLGTENLVETSISLSPNPASNYITLDAGFQIEQVLIIDMLGNQHSLAVKDNQVNISNLPTGIYLAQVHNHGQFLTSRFVVE